MMRCLHICDICYVLLAHLLSLASLSNGQAAISVGDNSANIEHGKISLPDPHCTNDNTVCQEDITSLDAMKALHKQIDDDQSGNIDMSESQEFFRDELQNTDGFERQSIFHGKDDKISIEDLWNAWKQSMVYNWTVDDVVEWLISSVDLPQYAGLFKEKHINGSFLPRVAVNNHHYISKVLGIKNPVHKHKLSIKAMDVVLFGPTKKLHSVLKDIVLVTSVTLAIGGCWFAIRQNKKSREQMKRMMKDLDALQKAEDALMDMNEKLQKATKEQTVVVKEKSDIEKKYREEIIRSKQEAERLKTERQGSDLEEKSRLELAEEELMQLCAALKQAEKELELRWVLGAPSDLQQWLQFTFELEQQHFMAKQQAAQRQFGSARDACEKMRRKRTGILGSLRIAQSNSIDDIDQRIVQARMALEEIKQDIQERQRRWQTIERLCGFPVRSNPGLGQLENMLYGDGGTLYHPSSMVAPMTVEDADEEYPPHYSLATAMLFTQKPNGCVCSTSHAGIGPSLGDLKKRHGTIGSSSSLMKSPSQPIVSVMPQKCENQENAIKSSAIAVSYTSHSPPVSFHLDNSSVSNNSQESTLSVSSSQVIQNSPVPRSKSMIGLSLMQNGSKIPCLDITKTAIKAESHSFAHSGSDSNLAVWLSKPSGTVAAASLSNQNDDSLSGTESLNSKGCKKEKRKMKFIPKFMRKTD